MLLTVSRFRPAQPRLFFSAVANAATCRNLPQRTTRFSLACPASNPPRSWLGDRVCHVKKASESVPGAFRSATCASRKKSTAATPAAGTAGKDGSRIQPLLAGRLIRPRQGAIAISMIVPLPTLTLRPAWEARALLNAVTRRSTSSSRGYSTPRVSSCRDASSQSRGT